MLMSYKLLIVSIQRKPAMMMMMVMLMKWSQRQFKTIKFQVRDGCIACTKIMTTINVMFEQKLKMLTGRYCNPHSELDYDQLK